MNETCPVPSHSWEVGSNPGDDTVVMAAADVVLKLKPPKSLLLSDPPRLLAASNSSSERISTEHGTIQRASPSTQKQPVMLQFHGPRTSNHDQRYIKARPLERHDLNSDDAFERERSSNLSDEVDKVISYLDEFRFRQPLKNAKSLHENFLRNELAPRDSSSRRNPLIKNTLSNTTKNTDHNNLEDLGRLDASESIFRDRNLPMLSLPRAPSINKANSVHSGNLNHISPPTRNIEVDLDLSDVTNIIDSMCVTNHTEPVNWPYLEQVQRKVEELLVEARKQREATDEWVKAVQESVDRWVHEQRLLIQLEHRQARERAITQPIGKHPGNFLPKTVTDTDVDTRRKLYAIIDHQAKKIEELECRLCNDVSGDKNARGWSTPFQTQRIGAENRDSHKKFIRMVEDLESPTLPHISSKQVRPSRECLTLATGRRLVKFRNGTEREFVPDGTLITRYPNGDVKTEGRIDKKVIYWHNAEQTKETISPDGVHTYEYPNKQLERHYPDGRKEVIFGNEFRTVPLPVGVRD